MKIRLYHTIPEEGRTSSEVYARELAAALETVASAEVEVAHLYPRARLRRAAGSFAPAARIGGYLDRYVVYQWRARSFPADIHHLIDHGYGHLGFSLDPHRTVANFMDAMLYKFRAGELAIDHYPHLTVLANRMDLVAIRRAARVIAISESSRRDLLRFTGADPERVRVILLGVSQRFSPADPADPADRARAAHANGAMPLRILHVGHCGSYKNIEGILRALPRASRALGERIQFVKAGGPFTPAQRVLITQLGIEEEVVHLGPVSDEALPGVYRAADVLVMPSLHEGFGLPVLEAMASGTPVVSSSRGSLPEVVGDAGLIVDDPEDPDAIAAGMVRVLGDPVLRQDLRQRGLARAATFSWERTARATLAVYREVYEESR